VDSLSAVGHVRVESAEAGGGVVDRPLAAVGLQEGVLAGGESAVALLRGVLVVAGERVGHAVLVRVPGDGVVVGAAGVAARQVPADAAVRAQAS